MPINMKDARALCSPSELQLVLAAMPTEIVRLSAARLDSKIVRARRLRDKFRDVGDRQRREARGKSRPRGARAAAGNRGTRRKEALFAAVLAAFERRRAMLEVARTSATRRKAAGQAARKGAGKTAGTRARKKAKKPGATGRSQSRYQALMEKSEVTRRQRAQKGQLRANMRKIHGHVSSRGRRHQARRDSR